MCYIGRHLGTESIWIIYLRIENGLGVFWDGVLRMSYGSLGILYGLFWYCEKGNFVPNFGMIYFQRPTALN